MRILELKQANCDARRLRMRTCGSCDLSFPCSGALRTIELFRVVDLSKLLSSGTFGMERSVTVKVLSG